MVSSKVKVSIKLTVTKRKLMVLKRKCVLQSKSYCNQIKAFADQSEIWLLLGSIELDPAVLDFAVEGRPVDAEDLCRFFD